MENIIITVTDLAKSYFYDLEAPTNITVDKLKNDIVEVLKGYNPELFVKTTTVELFCNRIGRQIQSEETLENAGVWNGDYITVIEV